uniref:Uncharacterized protein n=1 Tax=Arundo donax TaxID=35708 RepID=A0A0A9GTH5_ARUDO
MADSLYRLAQEDERKRCLPIKLYVRYILKTIHLIQVEKANNTLKVAVMSCHQF